MQIEDAVQVVSAQSEYDGMIGYVTATEDDYVVVGFQDLAGPGTGAVLVTFHRWVLWPAN